MLTVFITSNQIPLHVHAVFCHNKYYIFVFFCQLHVQCIHLARGMMRMRIPSIHTMYVLYIIQVFQEPPILIQLPTYIYMYICTMTKTTHHTHIHTHTHTHTYNDVLFSLPWSNSPTSSPLVHPRPLSLFSPLLSLLCSLLAGRGTQLLLSIYM